MVFKPKALTHFRLGRRFVRLHGTRPVRNGHAIAHLLTKKAMHRQAVCTPGNIEQGTGKRIGLSKGVQRQRILSDQFFGGHCVCCTCTLVLTPSHQPLIRLHPAQRDIIYLGKVARDGCNRRYFHFV